MLKSKRILIIDDEVLIAEHLKSIIQSFGYMNIEMAHTPKSAIEGFKNYKPDIVLLDIRLDTKQEGIELGRILYEEYKIPFIYISAFSDKSILSTALSTHPASFITKPFKPTDIFAALNLVYINNPNLSKTYLNFKNGSEFVKLATKDIYFVEKDGNYINIHCQSKRYLLRNSIEWVIDKLPENIFLRVHRSFVVNLRHIAKYTSEYVFIQNIQIPVSRNIKGDLTQMLEAI